MTRLRPLARADRRAALDVLVDALADGPDWMALLPDGEERRAALRSLLGIVLADVGQRATVADVDGRVIGVAAWQPPGRYPMTWWRQLRAAPRLLPVIARLRSRFREVQRLGEAVDAAFPRDRVQYLQVLGVAPAAQRRGVGSALLADGLAAADAAGADTYLETGSEANVAYYEAHGFELIAPGGPLHEGGPTMWRMRRPARGAGSVFRRSG